ncbi:uncharacterized protein LOC108664516 isoform X2 [Hyalella azteca]|uniref:Uncharacterized protein LOC108664516 isoform X2 n=1 Tax=Hyalella azteca TaxID=294128 RepID=A0A979FUK6_HYAAZ|nr:uncharacterized protein LOC108664516 isoform X2 [Hyalella azteca]
MGGDSGGGTHRGRRQGSRFGQVPTSWRHVTVENDTHKNLCGTLGSGKQIFSYYSGLLGALQWCLCGTLVLLCATLVSGTTDTASVNQIFPISELCRGSRHQTRVIVGSLITSNAERELDCEVTFQTDTILQKFMLRFEKIELDCNDHLWIYDSAYSTGTPLKDLSCRDTLQNVATIYTHSNHVTLKYKTDEWGPLSNGFRLIITAFKHKNACRDFRCETTEFCVSRSLTCDSVNHCGDASDESNSYASCPSPPLGELLSLSEGAITARVNPSFRQVLRWGSCYRCPRARYGL